MHRTGILIVGGGPAGAAAAVHLARTGARPLIIERLAEGRDALCGGFLSWRTLERLEGLGLQPEMLGGHEVAALRLFAGSTAHEIPLPARSMGLSRARLDRLLLERALAEGASLRHGTARAYAGGGLRLEDGETLPFDALFLATGKRELRGLARPQSAAGSDPMLGLRLRLPASERLAALLHGHIEMHLFGGGYLGIVLQEDGSANACMAVRKSRLTAAGSPALLFRELARQSPQLAERLAGMSPHSAIDAVGHIPYGWRARETSPGVFRLGDQAGVIASLAGEGIAIALASAELAARYWRDGGGGTAPAFQQEFERRLRRPLMAGEMAAALTRNPRIASFPLWLLAHSRAAAHLLARMSRMD